LDYAVLFRFLDRGVVREGLAMKSAHIRDAKERPAFERPKFQKQPKNIRGAVVEHWMDKALRQHRPINLEGNVPRISADTLVKLNDLRNSLLGTNHTLYQWAAMDEDEKLFILNGTEPLSVFDGVTA
jgi:hypothetical protein